MIMTKSSGNLWTCPECHQTIMYMESKAFHSKAVLEHLYFFHSLSLQTIAELFSVTSPSIVWQMNKYGLERDQHRKKGIHKLTVELTPLVINKYNEGKTVGDIAQIYNIGRQTITSILERAGIPRRHGGRRGPRGPNIAKETQIKIIGMYKDGHTGPAIAQTLNTSEHEVYYTLEYNGIPRRPSRTSTRYYTGSRRRLALDQRYFADINREENAYWLGFLCADGYVSTPESRRTAVSYTVGLRSIDKDHIEKFRSALCSEHKIGAYAGVGSANASYSIAFSSKILVNDLMRWGCLPHKGRKDFGTPNIDSQLLGPFYRGYFDGDGGLWKQTVKNGKDQWRLSCMGADTLINEFGQWVKDKAGLDIVRTRTKHPNSNNPRCEWRCGGNIQVPRVMDVLYNNGKATIYLNRKFLLYNRMKEELASPSNT